MKKKTLSLLLCLAFLLALLPATARADGACGDALAWTFDEAAGRLTIVGTGDMWDWSWSRTPWDAYLNQITSIELPAGLTTIGGRAFCGTKITSIAIPSGVTSIGMYAFSGCTGLTAIDVPNSVEIIGEGAFSGCTGLTSSVWPEPANTSKMTTVAQQMFMSCTNLASITLPARVNQIDNSAFLYCNNLKDVYYGGTKAQKENMLLRDSNSPLNNATWHFKEPPAAPPTIKTQPKSAKVRIGAKAKFTVKATGKDVTYQWYYRTSEDGEWILLEGQTSANLTVTATEGNIGWQFRCLVKNADGQAYSNPATLRQK